MESKEHPPGSRALHLALSHVSGACIDEDLLEEAERMLVFLDLVKVAPLTVGLIYLWSRCQRGDLREAQRRCEELSEAHPDVPDLLPLQAILRFALGDPTWRPICRQMLDSPSSTEKSRTLAQSLLDGSFNKKYAPAEAPAAEPVAARGADAFDYAAHASFMRA